MRSRRHTERGRGALYAARAIGTKNSKGGGTADSASVPVGDAT
jgi:hypothetical protein